MVRQLVQIKASTLLYILFYLSIAVISLLPALAASSKELILLETVEREVEAFIPYRICIIFILLLACCLKYI